MLRLYNPYYDPTREKSVTPLSVLAGLSTYSRSCPNSIDDSNGVTTMPGRWNYDYAPEEKRRRSDGREHSTFGWVCLASIGRFLRLCEASKDWAHIYPYPIPIIAGGFHIKNILFLIIAGRFHPNYWFRNSTIRKRDLNVGIVDHFVRPPGKKNTSVGCPNGGTRHGDSIIQSRTLILWKRRSKTPVDA